MRGDVTGLFQQRLIICLGTGGVGKTTLAAALGLAAALHRRNTAVITVDPARRLKDSLGLDYLPSEPHRIPLDDDTIFDALLLDAKHTFDALVARFSPSSEIADRIFANRLYQELSSEIGGSTEYMAMEKLHELLHQDLYDLIVVDTPPSAHARDLLRAPLRISELLATGAIRILKAPASILAGSESGIARATLTAVLKALQRWTGVNLLQDLSDFAANFEHLAAGFHSRAAEVDRELRRRTTSFVLITTPEPNTVEATIDFHRELRENRFPVAGIIANRVHKFRPLRGNESAPLPDSLRKKLIANYREYSAISARDARALKRLQRETGSPLLSALPVLPDPPVSFEGLRRFARLLGDEARPTKRSAEEVGSLAQTQREERLASK
jgi:anion-transporting  ArsA/GET3 family ATPase